MFLALNKIKERQADYGGIKTALGLSFAQKNRYGVI